MFANFTTAAEWPNLAGLGLASYLVEHQRHAVATIDAHRPTATTVAVRTRIDPRPSTGINEQLHDVPRHVAEVVAEVLVRLFAMDVGAIDERAAIGPDETPDEWPRILVDDRPLPALKLDLAFVLLARSVLREQAFEMARVDREIDAETPMGPLTRSTRFQGKPHARRARVFSMISGYLASSVIRSRSVRGPDEMKPSPRYIASTSE